MTLSVVLKRSLVFVAVAAAGTWIAAEVLKAIGDASLPRAQSSVAGLGPEALMARSASAVKAAAAKDPDNADELVKVGNFYLDHNRIDEAVEPLMQALKIDPGNGPALENLGFVYYRKHDYEKAVKYLHQAAEKIPDSASLHNTLGGVYRETKQLEKALEEHRKAASLQKDAPYSWYNIALILHEMKSPEEATAWQRYLSLASSIPSEASYVETAQSYLKKIVLRKRRVTAAADAD